MHRYHSAPYLWALGGGNRPIASRKVLYYVMARRLPESASMAACLFPREP
ncbi:MAG: hypothetical protein OJF49_000402 [Ktedonobacterales bacterium]|nr:MAG: hypothetical protein OJF49_000402 [Ktedonobacterales bacterium]